MDKNELHNIVHTEAHAHINSLHSADAPSDNTLRRRGIQEQCLGLVDLYVRSVWLAFSCLALHPSASWRHGERCPTDEVRQELRRFR